MPEASAAGPLCPRNGLGPFPFRLASVGLAKRFPWSSSPRFGLADELGPGETGRALSCGEISTEVVSNSILRVSGEYVDGSLEEVDPRYYVKVPRRGSTEERIVDWVQISS